MQESRIKIWKEEEDGAEAEAEKEYNKKGENGNGRYKIVKIACIFFQDVWCSFCGLKKSVHP